MPLIYGYYLLLVLTAGNVALVLTGRKKYVPISGVLSVLVAGFCYLAIIYFSGHFPASGDFEKFLNIIFVVLLIGTVSLFITESENRSYGYLYVSLAFLLYLLFVPHKSGEDYFMYENPWVVLFFQFRITSLALFSYAFSVYICLLSTRNSATVLMHKGRNFTLLGAVFFLSGEFSGSVWAWLGWGDPWRWSNGFYMATVIFILALATSHLPLKIMTNPKNKIRVQAGILLLIILIYTI
jgi:hypothetical protein